MNKILLYTENYLVGGGNKYLADIVNSIPDDYEVFLVSNIGGLSDVDFKLIKRPYSYQALDVFTSARIDGYFVGFRKFLPFLYKIFKRILFYLSLPYFQRKNIEIFSDIINEIQPVLVFSCNGGYPAALSCLDLVKACKKNHKKSILTVVSTPMKRSIIDCFYKDIADIVGAVIVNSNLAKKVLGKSRKFNENKISVVYNSVNNYSAEDWSFNKDSGEILLAYVGRIEKNKGSYVLLEAFKSVINKKNVRLLMIGSGPEADNVKRFAKSLGIEDRVIFTGYLDVNISAILSKIDVFVFPSFWEGFPYSVLEAMNAGKIIISTNVGGIPEMITNKEDGVLINPKNVSELSIALSDVLSDIDKYKYLGINAKEKVDKNFKFSIFRDNIIKLLSSFNK